MGRSIVGLTSAACLACCGMAIIEACCSSCSSGFPRRRGPEYAREHLLRLFPVGSRASAAASWLEGEGFVCREQAVDNPRIFFNKYRTHPHMDMPLFEVVEDLSNEPEYVHEFWCSERWRCNPGLLSWHVMVLHRGDDSVFDYGTHHTRNSLADFP